MHTNDFHIEKDVTWIINETYSGKFPVADPPEYGDSDYKMRGGRIIQGSPALFLSLVRQSLDIEDEETLDNVHDLAKLIESGKRLDAPTLYLNGNQVVDHDGRHRAEAVRMLGQEEMPILLLDIHSRDVSRVDFLIKENPNLHPRMNVQRTLDADTYEMSP